jgi:hypothetical protein
MVGCVSLPCPQLDALALFASRGKGFGLCSDLTDPFGDALFQ